jgi:hypothetical protein
VCLACAKKSSSELGAPIAKILTSKM